MNLLTVWKTCTVNCHSQTKMGGDSWQKPLGKYFSAGEDSCKEAHYVHFRHNPRTHCKYKRQQEASVGLETCLRLIVVTHPYKSYSILTPKLSILFFLSSHFIIIVIIMSLHFSLSGLMEYLSQMHTEYFSILSWCIESPSWTVRFFFL